MVLEEWEAWGRAYFNLRVQLRGKFIWRKNDKLLLSSVYLAAMYKKISWLKD
jgi:hypothetical protein